MNLIPDTGALQLRPHVLAETVSRGCVSPPVSFNEITADARRLCLDPGLGNLCFRLHEASCFHVCGARARIHQSLQLTHCTMFPHVFELSRQSQDFMCHAPWAWDMTSRSGLMAWSKPGTQCLCRALGLAEFVLRAALIGSCPATLAAGPESPMFGRKVASQHAFKKRGSTIQRTDSLSKLKCLQQQVGWAFSSENVLPNREGRPAIGFRIPPGLASCKHTCKHHDQNARRSVLSVHLRFEVSTSPCPPHCNTGQLGS